MNADDLILPTRIAGYPEKAVFRCISNGLLYAEKHGRIFWLNGKKWELSAIRDMQELKDMGVIYIEGYQHEFKL